MNENQPHNDHHLHIEPCPCGNPSPEVMGDDFDADVSCDNCGRSTPNCNGTLGAIKYWNRERNNIKAQYSGKTKEELDAGFAKFQSELATLQDVHDTRLNAFEEYKKVRDAELAAAKAECADYAERLIAAATLFEPHYRGATPKGTVPTALWFAREYMSTIESVRSEFLEDAAELAATKAECERLKLERDEAVKDAECWEDHLNKHSDDMGKCNTMIAEQDIEITFLRTENNRLRYDKLTLEGITEMWKQEKARADSLQFRLDSLEK